MIVNTQCSILKEGTTAVGVQVGFLMKESTFSFTTDYVSEEWLLGSKKRMREFKRYDKYNSRNEKWKKGRAKSNVRRLNLE